MGALHQGEKPLHFQSGQHHGNPHPLLRAGDAIEPGQVHGQNFLVEKQNGRQGLFLGGSGHVAFHREGAQKGLHFRRTHFRGMAFLIEEDETLNPMGVGLFRPSAVVLDPDSIADHIHQPGFGRNAMLIVTLCRHNAPIIRKIKGIQSHRTRYTASTPVIHGV